MNWHILYLQRKVAIKNIDYGICMIVDTKEYYSDSVEMLNKISM